jgi:hypothetical protein
MSGYRGEIVRLGLPLRLAASLTVVLYAASGCGAQAKEGPLGTQKSNQGATAADPSATPTATPDPPTVPTASNDKQGRIAFATYVIKALEYAQATNDPAPVKAVAMKGGASDCGTCEAYYKYLAGQQAKGQVRKPATLPIVKVYDQGQVQQGLSVVDVIVNRPALADVDEAGTRHSPQPAIKGYLYELGLQFDHGAWRLTGWLEKKK